MKCLICGSDNIQTTETIISDFVLARIDPHFEQDHNNRKTKLCFCKDCTFAFYEYRYSKDEESLLYQNYRDENYQKTREKYECWYTKRVNDAVNNGNIDLQQKIIKKVLLENGFNSFRNALDYGGNQGATFYKELGTDKRYVYDISGVVPLPGVIGIDAYEELLKESYDFIMCNMVFEHLTAPYEVLGKLYYIGNQNTLYYIEVPSENPYTSGNKFSIAKNFSLLFNRNYSWIRLAKYYYQQRHQPFMPMKEHINFFTRLSIKNMVENSGFSVIDIQENKEGNSIVLSILFRKNQVILDTDR